MRVDTPILRFVVICLLLQVSVPLAAAAEPPAEREQQLGDHLQRLDGEIGRSLERARRRAEAGGSPAAELAQEARRLRRHLDRLAAEVGGWDSPRRQALLERLRALGPAVGDLDAAATALRRDPGALADRRRGRQPYAGAAAKGAPANDDCSDAPQIASGRVTGDTSGAVNDGSASCGTSSFAPDVWFKYIPAATGEVYVNTFGSAFDTVLSVHSSCPSAQSDEIDCNDNQSGLQSALGFYAEEGTEYTLRVSGFAGAFGPFQLDVGSGGAISGTLTDAASGEAITTATVVVAAAEGYPRFSAAAGDDGSYTIAAIEPGTYHAFVESSAPWVPAVYGGGPCPGICDPEGGTAIEVSASSAIDGIDFVLDLGGSIDGTVREAAGGEPIAPARIEIWNDQNDGYAVAQAFTDEAGRYSVEGLAAGVYFATVDSDEHLDELFDGRPCPGGATYGCDPLDGEAIEVMLDAATAGIDFALDRLGAISGVITDAESGEPAPWVDVSVFDAGGNFAGSGDTDGDGRYTAGGLPPGSYFARASSYGPWADELYDDIPCPRNCDPTAGTPIAVTSGVTAGIDFALDPLGAISGRVTAEAGGEAATGVRVVVWNDRGEHENQADVFGPSGLYQVEELPPGNYFVTTDSDGSYPPDRHYLDELYDDLPCFSGAPEGCDPTAGMPVAVSAGAVTPGIDFALVASGTISGAVTAAATGEPLSHVSVAAYDQAGINVASTESSDGVYTLTALAEGSYFVATSSDPWIDEVYDGVACDDAGCDPAIGTPVAVSFGMPVSGIDFTLARDGGIAGTVMRAEGGALAGYRIMLEDAAGEVFRQAATDDAGGYVISGLAGGSYFVRTAGFQSGPEGPTYRDEVYDDLPCPIGCDPTAGMPVAVAAEGLTVGIDFVLDLLGSISGTVTTATGAPISYAAVAIYDGDGDFVASENADASGAFTVHGAPVGSVFAVASNYGYASELYDGIPCGDGCDVTAGTPIAVGLGEAVSGIDFVLDLPGTISGTVVNAATGHPLHRIDVEIWHADGGYFPLERVTTDPAGAYIAEGLVPGSYFVTARADPYFGELYPDLPCPEVACDVTAGMPVQVSHGADTAGIDFELTLAGVVSGQVIDAATGEEIYADVVLWDENGDLVQSQSGPSRYAFLGIPAGTYFVSAAGYAYHGQLHDGVACPGGPPLGCDPTGGTPLTVTDSSYHRVDFALARRCMASDTALCLNGGRFRVEATWQDSDANAGAGRGVELTGDSGYFWFFNDANVEMATKVLDACALPGFNNFWVFAAGLTNVGVELTVTDTVSGEVKTYQNPLGAPFQPIQDTGAFATCDAAGPLPRQPLAEEVSAGLERQLMALGAGAPEPAVKGICGGDSALCLAEDRFRVEAQWRTPQGETGAAQPVQLTDNTGTFWFFSAGNVEAIVKVLDACGLEGFRNFWLFAAGLTDVEVILTVTDTESGEVQEYFNPLGTAFQPIQDTGSFHTCP